MDRLWTDGPPTQTYTPPQPPQPPYAAPPAYPPPPPPPRDRGALACRLRRRHRVRRRGRRRAARHRPGRQRQQQPRRPPAPAPRRPCRSPAATRAATSCARVYAAASPSVVSVRTGEGSGTGFLVDSDGTIVTNAHVVGDNAQVQVRFTDDGDFHDARVLGVDASTDLAALKVDASAANGVKPLALADSDKVQVGDTALAIGYPLGLDRTATAGIVSGLERDIQAPNGFSIDKVIQTDAPINPGNSGGPLLNSNGEVIGVNSQIATAGGGNGSVGIGFAIPANTVKEVLPQLERGAAPEHAYLGVSTAPAPERRRAGRRDDGRRPGREGRPRRPATSSPRSTASTCRTPTTSPPAIEDNKPGDKVDVKVERNGSEHTIQVTLGQRPDQLP